jgi:aryl-alcohol dehydrogenase-like predicted oxidoreductase
MRLSIDASLKKLRTDYIDILYIHWWDYTTSVEEVMDGLHNLVVQGKVLYLARSPFSFTGLRSQFLLHVAREFRTRQHG